MELTPEERQKIFLEEKIKQEAKQKIANEQSAKGCMGCLTFIGVIIVLSIIISAFGGGSKETSSEPTYVDINASVRFTGTQFVIANSDTFDWTNVRMKINSKLFKSGYVLETSLIKAGNVYTVGALQFANDDGERFNPFQMKPQKFVISCDTPNGEGFYVGGWD